MPLQVKADSDPGDGQAAEGEAFGVLLQVDLLHGGLGVSAELQFHYVEGGAGAHDHVDSAFRGTDLHVGVAAQDGEEDVEYLLPVALVVSVVGVGDCAEEGLHGLECSVHVVFIKAFRHGNEGGGGRKGVRCHVVRYQGAEQADSNFLIGDAKGICSGYGTAFFDGIVSTLVEQRNDAFKPLGGGVELFFARQAGLSELDGCHPELADHLYEVGRRAASEPVGIYILVGEGAYYAERIVNVGRGPCEMIPVVIALQFFDELSSVKLHILSHCVYVIAHLREHLVFRDAADSSVCRVHADVP